MTSEQKKISDRANKNHKAMLERLRKDRLRGERFRKELKQFGYLVTVNKD